MVTNDKSCSIYFNHLTEIQYSNSVHDRRVNVRVRMSYYINPFLLLTCRADLSTTSAMKASSKHLCTRPGVGFISTITPQRGGHMDCPSEVYPPPSRCRSVGLLVRAVYTPYTRSRTIWRPHSLGVGVCRLCSHQRFPPNRPSKEMFWVGATL